MPALPRAMSQRDCVTKGESPVAYRSLDSGSLPGSKIRCFWKASNAHRRLHDNNHLRPSLSGGFWNATPRLFEFASPDTSWGRLIAPLSEGLLKER